jgi:hypothetical protein
MSATARVPGPLSVGAASVISSSLSFPFQWPILSHLRPGASAFQQFGPPQHESAMAYQYFSKVSLLSFMPSMMQVVTNESITATGIL